MKTKQKTGKPSAKAAATVKVKKPKADDSLVALEKKLDRVIELLERVTEKNNA